MPDQTSLNSDPQTLKITDAKGKVITVDAGLFKLLCRPVDEQQTAVAKLRSLQTDNTENNELEQNDSQAEATARERANEIIQRVLRATHTKFLPSATTTIKRIIQRF